MTAPRINYPLNIFYLCFRKLKIDVKKYKNIGNRALNGYFTTISGNICRENEGTVEHSQYLPK